MFVKERETQTLLANVTDVTQLYVSQMLSRTVYKFIFSHLINMSFDISFHLI
ncbi:hypothetical protein MtrunA17_Chr5g0421351 [Medicago truncatula]|uniref:Uncharacterized protein n=1 Tax=Medicago truncatula TaxID=3880 RepID=A0A396HQX4_MEDTR|nr:hypothetical protein MtrunA17_Chr5g0421351 [Medicago truncatula]